MMETSARVRTVRLRYLECLGKLFATPNAQLLKDVPEMGLNGPLCDEE